jgi:PAS domain S-box-containing protein
LCCLAANNQVIETEEFSCELSNKHAALARVGNRYGKQRAIWLWNVLLPTIYSIPIVVPPNRHSPRVRRIKPGENADQVAEARIRSFVPRRITGSGALPHMFTFDSRYQPVQYTYGVFQARVFLCYTSARDDCNSSIWNSNENHLLQNNMLSKRGRINQIMQDASPSPSLLFDLINDGLSLVDAQWNYLYVNQKAAEQAGRPREALLGKTMWDFFPEAKEIFTSADLQCALEEKQAVSFEVNHPALQTWLEYRCYPSELGLVILTHDITERKETETELARYAALVESSEDAIVSKTLQGIITSWNAAAERMFGYTATEAIGQSIRLIIPLELQQEEDKILEKLRQGIHIQHYETVRQRKDGTRIFVSLSISPVKGRAGNVLGAAKIARDVTERKKLEEELYESQERTQSALKGGSVTLYQQDRDLRYTWIFNPLPVYASEEIVGKTDADLIEPEEADYLTALKRRVLETGESYHEVIKATGIAGVRYFDLFIEPWRNRNGQVIGVTGTSRDVTEQVELEQRKDNFISIASHELRTPITVLSGFTQILMRRLNQREGEESLVMLQKMEAQISRLVKLIDELLDASKIQAGRLEYEAEPVDLDTLVHETLEVLQASSPTHLLRVSGATHTSIIGDKDRLGQVLTNLITNAIKYSPQANSVDILLSSSEIEAFIRVRDYGIGITPAHQQHIFDRFYRAHDASDTTFRGLGMGLYIAHDIVRRHGGDLTVESEEGKGSTFTLSLPLNKD